jgi:hypothetical protein
MRRVTLKIVPSMFVDAADRRFAEFRREQPALLGILSPGDVQRFEIRGCQPDGRVVRKRSYRLTLSEKDAALFQATSDLAPIEVTVVPLGPAESVDREFAEWWSRHVSLRRELGEDGYVVSVSYAGGREEKQYRVFVTARQVPLLNALLQGRPSIEVKAFWNPRKMERVPPHNPARQEVE